MDNSKSVPDLILEKRPPKDDDTNIEELPIYNINDLTNDKFNTLIQHFFENDNYYEYPKKFHQDNFVCAFVFGHKNYEAYLLAKKGDEEKIKKIIIKFLKFLKNVMVQAFYFHPFCLENDNDHDDDIVHLIGDVIKNSNNVIGEIYLPNSYLKDNVFGILKNYMISHTSLKHLQFDISKSKLSHICVKHFDDVIKSSNIEDISGLRGDDYGYFFESLLNNFFSGRNLNLDLFNKNINDDLVSKLSDMIKEKRVDYLMEINLSCNEITSKGFSMLVDSLLESKNKNIIEIYINDNNLDDNCIESLGKLIKKNENMAYIDLFHNKITDEGIKKLSEYVIGNISIKSININENVKITDVSSEVIKHMVKSSSVSSICLNSTNISEKNMGEIEELLKIPIEKREIPLITFQDVKSASKRIKE